jgi:hypothetical protein
MQQKHEVELLPVEMAEEDALRERVRHEIKQLLSEQQNLKAAVSVLDRMYEEKKAEVVAATKLLEQKTQLKADVEELTKKHGSLETELNQIHVDGQQAKEQLLKLNTEIENKNADILTLSRLHQKLEDDKKNLEDAANKSQVKDTEDKTDAENAEKLEKSASANVETADKEEKKSYSTRIYSFLLDLWARPVSKATVTLVFAASLLSLGAMMANILTLAAVATISAISMFASGLVYRRAVQAAAPAPAEKQEEAPKATTPAPSEKQEEASKEPAAANDEANKEEKSSSPALGM